MRKVGIALAYITALAAACFLTGCGSSQPRLPETKYIATVPEDQLLVDCDVAPPPDVKDYMASIQPVSKKEVDILIAALKTAQNRERMQMDVNQKQMENILACNKQKKGLREWKARTLKEIDTKTVSTTGSKQ